MPLNIPTKEENGGALPTGRLSAAEINLLVAYINSLAMGEGYDGVTFDDLALKADNSALAAGLSGKADIGHQHAIGGVIGLAEALAALAENGGGASNWADLAEKPAVLQAIGAMNPAENQFLYFTASNVAALSAINQDARTLLAAADFAAMKILFGLQNVSNTSDADKPASTIVAAALALKADADDMAAALALKADADDMAAALGFKANASDVATALGFKADADAMTTALAGKSATGHTHTAAGITDFATAVLALLAADPAAIRTLLQLGSAALMNDETPETATCFDILMRQAGGMLGDGVALDTLISAWQSVTPVAGAITHPWPIDPSEEDGRTAEVVQQQAFRTLNDLVLLTAANSSANSHLLIYPDPPETEMIDGMENRVVQSRLVNQDEVTSLVVGVAPYVAGRRRARWRGSLTDVTLAPGDEMLARAHCWGGEFDIDQFVRRAVWADIAVVAGSAGVTAGLARNVPNILTGDFIPVQAVRIGGQAIGLPSDKGYAYPGGLPYGTDGRLLQPAPNRATRVAWTWAIADGTFATGNFTSATAQIIAGGYRNVAAVRQIAAAYSDGNTSVDWPALPLARVPKSWVIGIVNATQAGFAPSPTGSTVDASYPNAGATNVTLWHFGDGQAYAPAPTTVPSCAWACTVLEIIPRRLD